MSKNVYRSLLFVFGVLIFALPSAGHAANLQYGSVGLVGQDEFEVTYSSPDGDTNFVCSFNTKECEQQNTPFAARPPTDDIDGTVYWSPQNTYAVAERPLNVFDKYLYRIYRNEGDDLTPVGYVPYYERTTKLRFSQDESTLFLSAGDGSTAQVPSTKPYTAASSTINTEALGRWVLSPDGNLIAGYKSAGADSDSQYSLVVQDLSSGDTVAEMPSDARHDIAITEDNESIAYIDINDGQRVLTVRSLSDPDSVSEQVDMNGWLNHLVTADGNFYFVANDSDEPYEYHLYRHDPTDNDTDRLESGIAETVNLQATPRHVLFGKKDSASRHIGHLDTQTQDTFIYDLMDTDEEASRPAVRKQVVKIGDNLTGALLTPQARNPQKALVWLHGGPHQQASPGYNSSLIYGVYDELLNAYARDGWAVLKLDYTGSVGYSADFRDAIVNKIGSKDVADTNQAIDWLNEEFDDPDVNLMGVSYGGYLSLKTAVEHPQKVNRTVSVNGVTDWMTDTLIDPTFRPYFGGRPSPETIDAYMQSSLIYDLENLDNTPMAIIQSTEDNIVDPVQAALLDRVANKEGIPSTYETIEGAPHTMQKRSHLNELCRTTEEFLSAGGVCAMR
jgi:dipeptidyl aminopeptidase/acylaminoacyl peptidase